MFLSIKDISQQYKQICAIPYRLTSLIHEYMSGYIYSSQSQRENCMVGGQYFVFKNDSIYEAQIFGNKLKKYSFSASICFEVFHL
jgi:hypothetical protein